MNNKFFFTSGQFIGLFDFLINVKDQNQRCILRRCEQAIAPITAISSLGNLVVTGGEDGGVTLWDVSTKEPYFKDTLLVHQLSSISSICINEMFGLVICCDLNDLRLLEISHIYDVEDQNSNTNNYIMTLPKKVLMTDGLGYILVLTARNEIVNFTSSLERIKSMTYDVKIVDF